MQVCNSTAGRCRPVQPLQHLPFCRRAARQQPATCTASSKGARLWGCDSLQQPACGRPQCSRRGPLQVCRAAGSDTESDSEAPDGPKRRRGRPRKQAADDTPPRTPNPRGRPRTPRPASAKPAPPADAASASRPQPATSEPASPAASQPAQARQFTEPAGRPGPVQQPGEAGSQPAWEAEQPAEQASWGAAGEQQAEPAAGWDELPAGGGWAAQPPGAAQQAGWGDQPAWAQPPAADSSASSRQEASPAWEAAGSPQAGGQQVPPPDAQPARNPAIPKWAQARPRPALQPPAEPLQQPTAQQRWAAADEVTLSDVEASVEQPQVGEGGGGQAAVDAREQLDQGSVEVASTSTPLPRAPLATTSPLPPMDASGRQLPRAAAEYHTIQLHGCDFMIGVRGGADPPLLDLADVYVLDLDTDIYARPEVAGPLPGGPGRYQAVPWVREDLGDRLSAREPDVQVLKMFLIAVAGEGGRYQLDLEQVFVLDAKQRSLARAPVERRTRATNPADLTLRILADGQLVLERVQRAPSAEEVMRAAQEGRQAVAAPGPEGDSPENLEEDEEEEFEAPDVPAVDLE